MLLVTCVKVALSDGRPVSAKGMARRLGADRRLVEDVLRKMVKEGAIHVYERSGSAMEPIYQAKVEP